MRDFSVDHSALALNTATLGHNLDGHGAGWSAEQIIDACAERGYGGITFWLREFAGLSLEQVASLGQRTRDAGMSVCGLCRTPYIVGVDSPAPRAKMLDQCKHAIATSGALEAGSLTIVVGGVNAGTLGVNESLEEVAEIVAELAPIAEAHGTRLGLEPLHPVYAANRSCLASMRDAVDLVQQIAHPAVGVAVDVYHVWWDTSLAYQLGRLQARQIHGLHLCDWLHDTTDVLLDRGMMGNGVANLKSIRQAVEQAGYTGLCEVEIFSANNWWKKPPAAVLDELPVRFRTHC